MKIKDEKDHQLHERRCCQVFCYLQTLAYWFVSPAILILQTEFSYDPVYASRIGESRDGERKGGLLGLVADGILIGCLE